MFPEFGRCKSLPYATLGTGAVTVPTRLYAKLAPMTPMLRRALLTGLLLPVIGGSARAQPFESVGSRAQGMGGAFVGVADDASAVYWNPGGLASGAYFSLVLDRTSGESVPDGDPRGGSHSGWLLALSAPAIGLSYYRLRENIAVPVTAGVLVGSADSAAEAMRLESLVTHHAGATLVQSIVGGVSVGATVKLVRGIAAVETFLDADAEDLLGERDMIGEASNRFDADVGVLASAGVLRAGLTVRNLVEPAFESPGGTELKLERQARAGVSLLLTGRWLAAADVDLTEQRGAFGDVRSVAVGVEGGLATRVFARAGFRFNAAGGDTSRQPVATFGGSYAAMGSLLVDAQVTVGSDKGSPGWGVAGRVVF
jgi:hypothetical protein